MYFFHNIAEINLKPDSFHPGPVIFEFRRPTGMFSPKKCLNLPFGVESRDNFFLKNFLVVRALVLTCKFSNYAKETVMETANGIITWCFGTFLSECLDGPQVFIFIDVIYVLNYHSNFPKIPEFPQIVYQISPALFNSFVSHSFLHFVFLFGM